MKNNTSTADLQTQNTQLNRRVVELENTVAELSSLVEHFKELFALSQKQRFGASSEKTLPGMEQLSLFHAAPAVPPPTTEIKTEEISYTRKKRHVGKREADLSALPLEVIEYDLPEDQRNCPQCGGAMKGIGVDTRDEIKIIPPQVIHVEHRRKVYKCDHCDKHADKTPIVKAESPNPVIKGSVASPSAVAYVMSQKYLLHLPLYRLEQDFKRQGVAINRQNMANWVIRACEDWLQPIYERMKQQLLAHDVLHSDDTGVQVLKEPGKTPQAKSNMWMYRTSGDSKTPVAFYEYQPSREGEHPENFLKGWAGFCHTDGFAGYHGLDNVTVVGCWAHVRRKFNDAFQITKAPDSSAKMGLDYCNRLFELEREFENMTPGERFEARLERSKPVAEAFFAWADTVCVPPKLAITRAVTYLLNQREWLMNVYLDGRLELSNNRGERSIKPFVMGRKNWLFSNSVAGVKTSAIAFSIIETAKENRLIPFEYLRFLLEELPNTTTAQFENLLPWSDKLPPECKMST
jgi:transposase